MSATCNVQPAECFVIRNGLSWAHVFVRHGVRTEGQGDDQRRNSWASIAVVSDFGAFGFVWSHMGDSPWQTFLAEVDFHYAMNKMWGDRFMVPMSVRACVDQAKALLASHRRRGRLTRERIRDAWDALNDDMNFDSGETFLADLERATGLTTELELWDNNWREPNPQARAFWKQIWPHFIAALPPVAEAA